VATITTDDEEILSWLVKLHFAQASHLSKLLGRSDYVLSRRLRALGPSRVRRNGEEQKGFGYVDSLRPTWSTSAELVWHPTQKGWDLALDREWISRRISAADEKSPNRLQHELLITDLILGLKSTVEGLLFTRHHHDLYDRWSLLDDDRINPDLFFAFESKDAFPSFFVEVENSREHHYRGGQSERMRKMHAYARYPIRQLQARLGIDDFYVLTLLRSATEVENFIEKLREAGGELATRRFWSAEYAALSRLGEPVFHLPNGGRCALADA